MTLWEAIIIILIPALVVLLTPSLWYIKSLSNDNIGLIMFLIPFAGFGIMWYFLNIWVALISLIPSSLLPFYFDKQLNTTRCPHCHKCSLKTISAKEVVDKEKSSTRYRIDSVTGRRKDLDCTVDTDYHVEYKLWCPHCEQQVEWKSDNKSRSRDYDYRR